MKRYTISRFSRIEALPWYQPVLGTVAYDDANKRMNVTTTSGANGKASGRLKSYKFCEGAQQFDVTLPVGADGDFICMVTHATDPAMTNGIGVGLQSDGAGNWNLATLSGTTVTEGADSGLDDGDVARIEIEKDLSGAYWYYIYDASGAKPTTATGKLFTTLTEGYTGWYAKGNSKTSAIDNISIRAESIVGRTNVEVTEPFWFRDDFGENSLGRYIIKSSGGMTSSHSKIEDGYFKITRPSASMTGWMYYPTRLRPTRISGIVKMETTTGYTNNPLIFFNVSGTWYGTNDRVPAYGYGLRISSTSITLLKYDSSSDVGVVIGTYVTTVPKDIDFEYEISITNDIISVKWDTVENVIEVNDSTYTDGYVGLACWSGGTYCDLVAFNHIEISGTRVYEKPIHRGAMLETYHDGTQEVVGTTFIDDCQWDRSGEYTSLRGTWTHDTTNGYIQVANTSSYGNGYLLNSLQFDEGVIEFDVCRTDGGHYGVVLLSDGTLNSSKYHTPTNGILIITTTNGGEYVNGALVGSAYTGVTSASNLVWQNWRIELKKSQGQILLYLDGVLARTYTIAQNHANGGIVFFAYNISSSSVRFKNIKIIATSPDATNGIAACIPPIGGGARYGVVESVYNTFTTANVDKGVYLTSVKVKTTNPNADEASLEFINETDSTTLSLERIETEKPLTLNADYTVLTESLNIDDEETDILTVGVKNSTTCDQSAIYVDFLSLIPVSGDDVLYPQDLAFISGVKLSQKRKVEVK